MEDIIVESHPKHLSLSETETRDVECSECGNIFKHDFSDFTYIIADGSLYKLECPKCKTIGVVMDILFNWNREEFNEKNI
jgi:hypothetical protein